MFTCSTLFYLVVCYSVTCVFRSPVFTARNQLSLLICACLTFVSVLCSCALMVLMHTSLAAFPWGLACGCYYFLIAKPLCCSSSFLTIFIIAINLVIILVIFIVMLSFSSFYYHHYHCYQSCYQCYKYFYLYCHYDMIFIIAIFILIVSIIIKILTVIMINIAVNLAMLIIIYITFIITVTSSFLSQLSFWSSLWLCYYFMLFIIDIIFLGCRVLLWPLLLSFLWLLPLLHIHRYF